MTGAHRRSGSAAKFLPRGLTILYEDADILVVDKPAGLLTISTTRDKTRTAYFVLTDYVRKGYARSPKRLFIVHRLDRDTSGVLVFAKTEEAKLRLQDQWKETEKHYLAVVHGRVAKSAQTISTCLAENTAHVVYSTANAAEGKLSHTAYRVVRQTRDFSLLEVELLTGRKHQIRVHLAGIGHPVVGDAKYGKGYGRGRDSHQRLALHAKSLSLTHPASGKRLTFEAPVPAFFATLVGPIKPQQGTMH